MKTFGRVLTAMITSFNNDGSLNIENSVAIAHHLLDNGSDGLVVCGTTGENPTMSKEDKIALFTAIAKECGHKGSIIANVGSNDTKASVDFVKEVSKIDGIDGLLVVVPYYNNLINKVNTYTLKLLQRLLHCQLWYIMYQAV